MIVDIYKIVSTLALGNLSFVAPKEHESASCSRREWWRTQRLGLDSPRGRSGQWPCISFGHQRMLWIPFYVGFRAASECLTFSRLWTWGDLTLAPWLWWRPTALKLRKKLGITPRSMQRMWVCTSLGALTGEFSACPSSYKPWQALGWCSATTHVLQAAIRQNNWLLSFSCLLLHFVDVASIRELNAGGLFCHVKLLVLMSSVKKGSHDGVSSKLPGPRSMAWGEMRFAPKRSERCVAVATAK